jgi:hypothetical protein
MNAAEYALELLAAHLGVNCSGFAPLVAEGLLDEAYVGAQSASGVSSTRDKAPIIGKIANFNPFLYSRQPHSGPGNVKERKEDLGRIADKKGCPLILKIG